MKQSLTLFCLSLVMISALLADYDAGLRAFDAKDYATALKEWQPLAEQGHKTAQNALGYLFERGLGVPRDAQAAAKWYRSAAEQGYAPAEYNLGLLYRRGEGVAQSDEEALGWLKRAADAGIAAAALNLGNLYYKDGKGDVTQAINYWRTAAEHDDPIAAYNLGYLYSRDQAVQRNDKQAAQWFRLAADENYGPAQYALALLYQKGLGVPADPVQARMWLELAARAGNREAEAQIASVDRKMAREQVAKARGMAADWRPKRETLRAGLSLAQVPDPGAREFPRTTTQTFIPPRIVGDPGPLAVWSKRTATGFFINDQGYVLTSADAVNGCTNIFVKTPQEHQRVKVIAQDAEAGVAVIGPVTGSRRPLPLSDSPASDRQENVVQLGYRLADEAVPTSTRGVIQLSADGLSAAMLRPEMPQSATNAGGPMLDESGRVVAYARPHSGLIGGKAITRFLDRQGIAYTSAPSATGANHASNIVLVECRE